MTLADVLRQTSLIAVTGRLHGLGNRVRVVLGARSLARLEERRFFYTWHTGADFGSRFDELWDIEETQVSRTTARLLSVRYPWRDEKLAWIDTRARRERVWQIKTPHSLVLPTAATPWESELQALHPAKLIGAHVHDFFDAHLAGDPYIGVMVRAHQNSHPVTLAESPLSWYVERMLQLRRLHPGIRFFVSADTREVQDTIVDTVPGSVALIDKGGYNTRAGLSSAVIDLYLLASAGHLLAPHYSSFPELAQKLAGPELALETSHSDPETAVRAESGLMQVDDPTAPHVRHRA